MFPKMKVTYDTYNKDIAVVHLFLEALTVFQLQQTWISFFSTVGGLLGFCIGISLVSFIEQFWLAVKIMDAVKNPVEAVS
jgi:hypothetical protein